VAKKKSRSLSPLAETLILPTNEKPVLELDELWSFVFCKRYQQWVWIALCRETRQIVGYAVGNRKRSTCLRLWKSIPKPFKKAVCFTDFWEAYRGVVPRKQHRAIGKETGQTAHVERWNNTLRQRLSRFVRKTLSFSKCPLMHETCLYIFLHNYNRSLA
jgi:insertion element IS1 protein InsB